MVFYLAQRFVTLLTVMLVMTMLIFALMHAVPGGPFDMTQQPLPPFAMHNIEDKYGLDQPIWRQYLNWIWQLLHGYLGIPFEEPTMTVNHLIASAWPITLIVGGPHDPGVLRLRHRDRVHRRAQAQHLDRLGAHRRRLDHRGRAAQLRDRIPADTRSSPVNWAGSRAEAGASPGRDPSRHRVLALPDGADGALYAGQHSRSHQLRLRPDGPRARPVRSGGSRSITSCARR